MKCIRTKDGHITKVNKYYEEDGLFNITINGKPYFCVLEEDVLKQADTIEELCDGWVLESKAYTSGFFVIYNTADNKQIMRNFKLLKDEKMFAFIKTDKGLIYVAKMNEKGELELL